jgi:hypothetical protein
MPVRDSTVYMSRVFPDALSAALQRVRVSASNYVTYSPACMPAPCRAVAVSLVLPEPH